MSNTPDIAVDSVLWLTSPARTMRHLAAMGYIKETGQDEYQPTNFSKSLTIPIIKDGYPCLYVGMFEVSGTDKIYCCDC